jgi:hypothetical protein
MLTQGCETFGLSTLVLPKRLIGTYCGLRLEEDTLALLLHQPDSAAGALHLAQVACNLPLLLTLPVQPGESSLAHLVQGAFSRRALPPRRYVERLAALARQEEERFGTYSAPLLSRLQADVDHKRCEVTDLMGRDFLLHGFDVVDQAVGRLAEETAHLVSDRGSLALLQAQLETRLTSQSRELERVTQRLRTVVARLLTPLGARRRRRALRLTQEVTLLKLTLFLCRMLWREESMFQDFMTWLAGQRSRLQAIRNRLIQRTSELARERHELEAHNDVSERAGRGLCLTEALGDTGTVWKITTATPPCLLRHWRAKSQRAWPAQSRQRS